MRPQCRPMIDSKDLDLSTDVRSLLSRAEHLRNSLVLRSKPRLAHSHSCDTKGNIQTISVYQSPCSKLPSTSLRLCGRKTTCITSASHFGYRSGTLVKRRTCQITSSFDDWKLPVQARLHPSRRGLLSISARTSLACLSKSRWLR